MASDNPTRFSDGPEGRVSPSKLEKRWQRETAKARAEAKRRGITQATIDQAIEKRRYGQVNR
jgi:hypothetical protein